MYPNQPDKNLSPLSNVDQRTVEIRRNLFPENQAMSANSLPTVSKVIGEQYRIISEVGSGGMGTVYQCLDLALQRTVAIKLLRLDALTTDTALIRFQNEAKAMARLEHPNVVKIFSISISSDTHPYLVMEFLQGRSLREVMNSGPLPLSFAMEAMRQLCKGLAAAHAQNIVHRDLKPSNIIITESEDTGAVFKILDFGIAKLSSAEHIDHTKTGEIFGTPTYMSPEQCYGKDVDHRSDQYSLGCIFFEMLAGRPPFMGSDLEVLIGHAQEPPPSLRESAGFPFPTYVEDLVSKLLAKTPSGRFSSIIELAESLDRKAETPKTGSFFSQARENKRIILFASLLCVITIFLFTSWHGFVAASTSPEDAKLKSLIQKDPAHVTIDSVTSYGLTLLKNDKALRTLVLAGATKFGDKDMEALSSLPLEDLNLDSTGISGASMQTIGRIDSLTSLSLYGTTVNTTDLKALRKLHKLRYLNLARAKVDDNVLDVIIDMPSLEKVVIGFNPVAIHRNKRLMTLENSKVRSWAFLADALDDGDMVMISHLKNTQQLFLDGNPDITRKGLMALANMPLLRDLTITDSKLTDEDVVQFKRRATRCDVHYKK